MVNTVGERGEREREGRQLAAMTNGQVLSKFNCRNVTMRFEWQPLRMHFISHHPPGIIYRQLQHFISNWADLHKGNY